MLFRSLSVLLLALLTFCPFGSASEVVYRRVLVCLEGEPLADFHARSRPAIAGWFEPMRMDSREISGQRARLSAERQSVRAQLEQLGFIADGETDVVLHTLIGRLPESNLDAAQAVPGVRKVRLVREYRRHLDAAIPLVGLNNAWLTLGGEARAGRGIKIGILDTGVDISHPMLQDPGLEIPAGYPKGERDFTNAKVIVARNYVAMIGDPRDTANAMDRDGHGTFVGAIAAGRRAFGPWAEVAGAAPGAQLGNYRIYGSPLNQADTTDAVIIAALNDAVADGMNVINLSSGITAFDLPAEEPVPQAVAAAVRAGVSVVVSAGNDGFVASVAEPANSPSAIAVGASNNARIFGNALRVVGPGAVPERLQRVGAVPASSTTLTAALGPAPLYFLSNSCRAVTLPDDVRGKIAVVLDDANCSRATILRNLADGGAIAAVLYRRDNVDAHPMVFTSTPVPAFQIAAADGERVTAFLGTANQGQAVIEPGIARFPVDADRIASFSSRGPSNDGELKPDLVAPGTTIYSAAQINDGLGGLYSTTQFTQADGTSFSAPLVAGAVALVKQAHPAWTPAQLKSAVVNTALAVVTEGAQSAPLLASGAGRLDVPRAMSAGAAFDPVGLSFTCSLQKGPVTVRRSLRITNLGSAPESFSMEIRVRQDLTGASVVVEPASTSMLAPGESGAVQVTFNGPPSVTGSGSIDGRLVVKGNATGSEYLVGFWGQVVDSSKIDDLFRIRGQGQTGLVSTVLPVPLTAQVYDPDFISIAGVPVKFEVTQGGGTLSASEVTTNFAGVASVSLRLPDVPGFVQVKASATDQISKIFYATARPAPATTSAGVVNAASFTAALAPGGMISIFGSGLAGGTAAASALPLPLTLASAQVLLNGQPIPLYYASPTQINAQLPYGISGSTAELRVAVLGVPTAPVTVRLAPAAPGIFTASQDGRGTAIALHGDGFQPVTAANPARAGEVVVVFAAGMGAVQPAVAAGTAAPQPPAATATAPVVRIGGATARVLFSGLAPGFAGLYQVNVEIPAGAPKGAAVPLEVTMGGASSNSVVLPIG